MLTSEDLLIWGQRQADPWNRLGNNLHPFLVLIEFCQVEGPRPLIINGLSEDDKHRVDLDSISLWLMSSETTSGSISLLYNQESALYAISYYCTVYDIHARAFLRPLCVAYLFTNRPSSSILSRFSSRIRRLISPLLNCNRRLFIRLLSKLVALSDDINSDLVHEYYALYRIDQIEGSAKKKIDALAEQARKLRSRIEMMSDALSRIIVGDCQRHEDATLPGWLFEGRQSGPIGLDQLSPCEYSNFVSSLSDLLIAMKRKECEEGVLYSANNPILRFAKCSTPMKERLKREKESREEETLRTCTNHLDQILYPVIVGDDLVVIGSNQRRNSVSDMVTKLEYLRPKGNLNQKVSIWKKKGESCNGVFGIESSPRLIPSNYKRVLDLNSCQLHGVSYSGNLLSRLHNHRLFPSDTSLLSFISSSLTVSSQLVYMGRYIPFSLIVDSEKLSNEDQRIIVSLLCEVDFSKFCTLKEKTDKLPSTLSPKIIQLK